MSHLRLRTEDISKAEERFFGTNAHAVMEIFVRENLPLSESIEQYVVTLPYWMRKDARNGLIDFFKHVQASEGFKQFTDMLYSAICYPEKEILGRKGERFRIDLLLRDKDTFKVIDYKIGAQREEHYSQVKAYCDIVSRTGMKVEGWLLYLHKGSCRLVRVV